MRLTIFGLSVSSSWGNGHATLWRGLIRALAARGWSVTFFERDVPYYATTRDLYEIEPGELVLYENWTEVRRQARQAVDEADVVMVTSYCPDAIAATDLVADAGKALKVFYDLDTPVTLSRLGTEEHPAYIGERGLRDFDLVLSYTGGIALDRLRSDLGARHAAPLYGHVDPQIYEAGEPNSAFAADLSYLGTYATDRQEGVERFLVRPAALQPNRRFVIGGAQYPQDFPWTPNIYFVRHLPPADHPSFYASSRATLNVTRGAMAAMGWCPSGRLFEAASCGATILTDVWDGLDEFFEPGSEVLPLSSTEHALAALEMDDAELRRIGRLARERTLAQHTSAIRAAQLERMLEEAHSSHWEQRETV
ncbi:glycosyltransferase [Pseudaminobacter sp. 19-2017]|uniref:Glycosyltransferase n=1 Tax=Pseudaminobacter soli (ex Zhang et al. 2022) TaxID=2831468 RepID=A0A942I7X7_9HYPH|nr:glycosyltransferase [Pseudaminobacter soli]MBS3647556.1 glycosyltransferase [Pseudaminobacter soli]